jgi:hypothetical protein
MPMILRGNWVFHAQAPHHAPVQPRELGFCAGQQHVKVRHIHILEQLQVNKARLHDCGAGELHTAC